MFYLSILIHLMAEFSCSFMSKFAIYGRILSEICVRILLMAEFSVGEFSRVPNSLHPVWIAPAPLLYKIETLYSVFFVWSPTPCVVIMNSVNAFARLSAISVTYSTRFRLNMLNFHLWSFP